MIFFCCKFGCENNDIIIYLQDNIATINTIYIIETILFGNEEKLILGMLDETIEGCDFEGTLFKEKCSKAKIENNFKSIYSNNPINYTLFKSNNIRAKKSHLNYRQLLKTNQVTKKWYDCPLNYTSCGILDSLGKQLSVKSHEPFTLNNITILNLFYNNIMNFTEENKLITNNIDNNTGVQLISIITLSQYKKFINPWEK